MAQNQHCPATFDDSLLYWISAESATEFIFLITYLQTYLFPYLFINLYNLFMLDYARLGKIRLSYSRLAYNRLGQARFV